MTTKPKLSDRAKRMEHFKALHSRGGLNLVSLMDIFTVLVFFLLVSSGTQLPSTKDLTLPTSVATKVPQETLVITITRNDILVQGAKIAEVAHLLNNDQTIIAGLKDELIFQASKQRQPIEAGTGHAVTIMGDENIPYQLLKKILATCRQANYTRIAFAAMQKAKG
jgi:biopolymer transport protein TolR